MRWPSPVQPPDAKNRACGGVEGARGAIPVPPSDRSGLDIVLGVHVCPQRSPLGTDISSQLRRNRLGFFHALAYALSPLRTCGTRWGGLSGGRMLGGAAGRSLVYFSFPARSSSFPDFHPVPAPPCHRWSQFLGRLRADCAVEAEKARRSEREVSDLGDRH